MTWCAIYIEASLSPLYISCDTWHTRHYECSGSSCNKDKREWQSSKHVKLVVSWWVLQCGPRRGRRPRTSLRVAMKGACCGRENRTWNKDTGQKNPEINPYISSQFIFHKSTKNTQWEKGSILDKQSWICRASAYRLNLDICVTAWVNMEVFMSHKIEILHACTWNLTNSRREGQKEIISGRGKWADVSQTVLSLS